jgi:hypothetical protein
MRNEKFYNKSTLLVRGYLSTAALVAAIGLPTCVWITNATAAQPTPEQGGFIHAPVLIRSVSNSQQADFPSTYQFTLKVPENAGASLQALRITPDNQPGPIGFSMGHTTAFLGDSFAGGPAVSLANVGGATPENPNEVMVVFDPPIAPGKTVTVSLESTRNPRFGGVYFVGVTAFPAGQNDAGVFLGYHRFNIYGNWR